MSDRLPLRRVLIGLAATALLIGATPSVHAQQPLIRNYVPEVWQAPEVDWIGDQDGNKIDDRIDGDPGTGPFHIVVNFNECVTDQSAAELAALAEPNSEVIRLEYLSTVAIGGDELQGVMKTNVMTIAQRDDVAFIELMDVYKVHLDVSVPDICVAEPVSGPSGACECYAEFLGFTGQGINIAILDTGVDDHVHDAFNGVVTYGFASVQGYNAITQTPGNPDDDHHHGTHVASIALGRAGANVSRGVAREAGLIDIKIADSNGDINWPDAYYGIKYVYDMHQSGAWDVKVMVGSFGTDHGNNDGKEAMAQLVDLAESQGILFVASAGNDGDNNVGLSNPCAASRALCVANYDDDDTPDRIGNIWFSSSRGPRADDGDHDDLDELKPEVTAPGAHIVAALYNSPNSVTTRSGTSQAAPHVGGLAALVFQAQPGINAASVRNMIIQASDGRGAPTFPARDSDWNKDFGWGLVNACSTLTAATTVDLTYPNHPPSPRWKSPDIRVNPPPEVGHVSTVTVTVENRSPNPARGTRVHFGVHDFAAAVPSFYDIGTKIVDIPSNDSTRVSIDWTPSKSGHQCMKVELGYVPDSDYTNNKAQRNLTVAASPVTFQVRNTATVQPVMIDFTVTQDFLPEWEVNIDPASVILAADDCAQDIELLLIPPMGLPPGTEQIANVEAVAHTPMGPVSLGGVSVQDFVPGPTAVELASFDVTSRDGLVSIAWRTSVEAHHLGFNVLRSEEDGHAFERVNDDLIQDGLESRYEYIDRSVVSGRTYTYRLEAIDRFAGSQTFDLGTVTVGDAVPRQLMLHAAQPNPSGPSATIRFDLPKAARVELTIFDATGRAVRTLVDSSLDPGFHSVEWDGLGDDGHSVPSGIYIYRLRVGDRILSKKIVLNK